MTDRRIAAAPSAPPLPEICWEADYTAHPYLDPSLWDRGSRLCLWTEYTWERIRNDDDAYHRETARLLRPLWPGDHEEAPGAADVELVSGYLKEADVYIDSAIALLPAASRAHVAPLAEVDRCDDLRSLLAMILTGTDRRRRFEAQRKVYLANLLIDIDHARAIQDGPRHLAHFEALLERALWRYRREEHEVAIGYHVAADGDAIHYTSRPGNDDQLFTFHSSFLECTRGDRRTTLDVLYWSCRFKYAVLPLTSRTVRGRQEVLEPGRWGGMRQHRSGSVLSKMIRRGINNPSAIADLLGAMFIVYDEDALDVLLELLDAGLGNPFGWRNVKDGFGNSTPGARLNPHAARGYRVFKGDVDILVPGDLPGRPPYRFPVEIQVHTLESFLRTICVHHDAHHPALKLRQFLGGLVPYLFPAVVYGTDWLRFDPTPLEIAPGRP